MKTGFCHNSRRWLFKFVLFGTPRACVYREQGNNECKYKECAYYEERELPKHMHDDWKAFMSLAGVR